MSLKNNFLNEIEIAGRKIGNNHPPYLIAELSGNHKGSLEEALNLIDAAADANASAIKIQTYTADTITLEHDGPEFCLTDGLWKGRTLYDLYQEAHTPWEWHHALFEKAASRNIPIFSSPFDSSAIDLLESLNCPAYKIASFEINDIGLIKHAASTGKPMIISTGLATLEEIYEAVEAVADGGGKQLALLHCISGYPAPIEDCNLATIEDLKKRFSFPIGLSDHTIDNTASVAAVCLGASVIEKHFVIDKNDGSVDAAFSLEPEQFKQLVSETNRVKSAIGHAGYELKPSEEINRRFRRSLYCSQNIKKGEVFTNQNVRSVRPGLGLHTRYLPEILGKLANQDINFGTPLDAAYIETFTERARDIQK
jgi:N-acetylneuraminate synthase